MPTDCQVHKHIVMLISNCEQIYFIFKINYEIYLLFFRFDMQQLSACIGMFICIFILLLIEAQFICFKKNKEILKIRLCTYIFTIQQAHSHAKIDK